MKDSYDLICLSHLRWDFVFQRPHHLMSRCARSRRVFFMEEPIFDEGPARLERHVPPGMPNLTVCTPHLRRHTDAEAAEMQQAFLLRQLLKQERIGQHIQWFYTPMALPWVEGIEPIATVYDCMDELSAFKGAPSALLQREKLLFHRAQVVFTGGRSLYLSKRQHHPEVYAFPSSVDAEHFSQARRGNDEPEEQKDIPTPRVGFFGVIDERLDLELLASLAEARPHYQIVIVGPVVKIDPAALPQRPNIHYLGAKKYEELPAFLAGWDVAMMPFALNESTRFISPTKTLEYLAAHKAVVSTPIHDVVFPYGEQELVRIADAAGFPGAVDAALTADAGLHGVLCDQVLAQTSWDRTWHAMWKKVLAFSQNHRRSAQEITVKPATNAKGEAAYV